MLLELLEGVKTRKRPLLPCFDYLAFNLLFGGIFTVEVVYTKLLRLIERLVESQTFCFQSVLYILGVEFSLVFSTLLFVLSLDVPLPCSAAWHNFFI